MGGMRWLVPGVVAALGAALLLPAAGQAAGADALDERRLRTALLDHMDFSPEWAGDSERAAAERGIGVPVPRERACRALFEHDGTTSASAGFARTFTGPFVVTTAASHGGAAEAQRAMAAFRTAAERCRTFHAVEGAGETALTVTYEAGEAGTPGHGDDTAAVRYHRQPENGGAPEVIAEAVLVRVGGHTVLVAQAGRDDAGTGSLVPLAERAAEKLQEVAEGRTPAPPPQEGSADL